MRQDRGLYAARDRRSRGHRFVPWVLALGALDFGLEQFMIVPILPAVQAAESASLTGAAWLLTGFLVAAVAAAPIIGRLGALRIARRPDRGPSRARGRGGARTAYIGLARDQAPRERATVWIGLLVATAGAGAAIGLILGGVLVDYVSVAAVFWFLFALAVVLLLMIWALVPETPVRDAGRPDWAGGLLLSAGLLSILLAIAQGNSWGWSSTRVVALCAGSAVMFGAFVAVERSARAPLVDMQLFAQRAAWSANLAAFAMGFALFIAGVIVPQIAAPPKASGYDLGLTFAETGMILLPGALAIVLGGWASGVLVRRMGARALVGCGAVSAAVAYAALALNHGSLPTIVVANVALGLGIGLGFAAITNLVVRSVGEHRTSVFAATTAVSRSTGAALGAQIAAAIVIGAGVVGPGFPAPEGFTDAFVLGLVATLVALGTTAAMPDRTADPLLKEGTPDIPRARILIHPGESSGGG